MARRRKQDKIEDPHERARLKKLRAAQRREERKARKAKAGDSDEPSRRSKDAAPDYSKPMVKDDYLWIRASMAKSYAERILNDHRGRPYWLSIPHATGDGVGPVVNFYPCTTFRTKGRMYYGFLFREHRDLFFATLRNARKETLDRVTVANPQLF